MICCQSRFARLSRSANRYQRMSSGGRRERWAPNQSWISWSQYQRATVLWISTLVGSKYRVIARLWMSGRVVDMLATTHSGDVVEYTCGTSPRIREVVPY